MGMVQILQLALVFCMVAGVTLALTWLFLRRGGVRSRIKGISQSGLAADELGSGGEWKDRLSRAVEPVARLSAPDEPARAGRQRDVLIQAGFRDPSSLPLFLAIQTSCVIILPIIVLFLEWFEILKLDGLLYVLVLLIAAIAGYYLPQKGLDIARTRRQREIFEAFPDTIDLMVVCVEAGLGIDMAMSRASTEIHLRSPALAEDMSTVALELRIGASREAAMRNFAQRVGLPEVSSFVTVMIQADRFGTSIAQSLRIHSESLRTRRQQLAEEAAAKIPVKMLFPMIAFIFPALLLVLLGPSALQVYRTLFPALGGPS